MLAKHLLLVGMAAISLTKATAQNATTNNKYYGSVPPWDITNTQNFVGTPMLLDDWTTGKIVTEQGKEISDSSLLFNYNKLSRELNVTMDRKSFFQVDRKIVKSFTLHTAEGDVFFCKMPQIDKNTLFQLVATGKNFNVYKKIITTIRDNSSYTGIMPSFYYHTVVNTDPNAQTHDDFLETHVLHASLSHTAEPNDSLFSQGSSYAAYKTTVPAKSGSNGSLAYNYNNGNGGFNGKIKKYEDFGEYYIVENLGDKLVTGKFNLTKTSIDNAFGYYSADKANQYMNEHSVAPVDENFVRNIADYFNR